MPCNNSWMNKPVSVVSCYVPKVLVAVKACSSFSTLQLTPQAVADWQAFSHSDIDFGITIAALDEGVLTPDLAIIAESQLFGQRVAQRRRRKATSSDGQAELAIRSLTELQPGAPVVHVDHGVGRYHGLVTLDMDGQVQEFLLLEYADKAKLYVPVANLEVISRYAGADDASAPLHRLGTEQWTKARRKAAEQVRDTAAELLNLYARRAARQGYGFPFDHAEYALFASGFPLKKPPIRPTLFWPRWPICVHLNQWIVWFGLW